MGVGPPLFNISGLLNHTIVLLLGRDVNLWRKTAEATTDLGSHVDFFGGGPVRITDRGRVKLWRGGAKKTFFRECQ